MSDGTKIRWTETINADGTRTPGATWNPVRGCSVVSSGCKNCFAMAIAARFSGPGLPYEGLAQKVNGHPVWTGKIMLVPGTLTQPLRWKKTRRIFVNSMSDLFHPSVPNAYLHEIFRVMTEADWHTYMILTKRPERMARFITALYNDDHKRSLPAHIWCGTSVEDQKRADERLPWLVQVPAQVRFVSAEPLLGPVDLRPWLHTDFELVRGPGGGLTPNTSEIQWVICGGESGPNHRPMDMAWARDLRDQCSSSDVAFYFKQRAHQRSEQDPHIDGWKVEQWPDERPLALPTFYGSCPDERVPDEYLAGAVAV